MSDVVSKGTSDILALIDHFIEIDWSKMSDQNCTRFLLDVQKHIYFLESEIAQLKKACAEWSEVSQHNYQKAKSMALALDAIRAVVKAMPSIYEGEIE